MAVSHFAGGGGRDSNGGIDNRSCGLFSLKRRWRCDACVVNF